MKFEVTKTDNCFSGHQTYEYKLPIHGSEFIAFLGGWEVKEFHKYRRPLFTADKGDVNIKGILRSERIKVSFPEDSWSAKKQDFEDWLMNILS